MGRSVHAEGLQAVAGTHQSVMQTDLAEGLQDVAVQDQKMLDVGFEVVQHKPLSVQTPGVAVGVKNLT